MPEVYNQLPLFATPEDSATPRKRKKFPDPKPGCKFCNACEVEKPVNDFHIRKGKPHSECMECERARDRARWGQRYVRKTPVKPLPTKPGHKVCNNCFKEKPLNDFKKTSIFKDGHAGRCRQCDHDLRMARTEEEKASERARRRAYSDSHREQIRERAQARTKTAHHKQVRNARQRARYVEKAEARRIARLSAPPITSKICPKCNPSIEKPLEEFPLRKGSRDGHGTYCRECIRKHQNSEIIKKKRREREQAQGEAFKKSKYIAHKKWRREHIEEIRERDRRKYATDPEHAKRMRRHALKWIKSHPLVMQEHQLRRIARIKETAVERVDLQVILDHYGRWCYICEQEILQTQDLVFDHVIPLIPRPGEPKGTHTEDNIRPAHRECNGRKSNRRFEDLTPFDRRGVS